MYTLGKYTEHQRKNWAQSKRIIIYESESQLLDFIKHARRNSKPPNKKMYFGTIPEDLAARIKKDTGAELKGYNFSISENEIRKIFKSHGSKATEAPRGQRAITEADIASIPKIVQNPDKIILDNMLYNGKPAIKFVKTINGRTTVVSYVSDRHSDLAVQTMYSGKNKDGTLALLTDAQAPETTSKTGKGTGSATNNIQKKGKPGSLFGGLPQRDQAIAKQAPEARIYLATRNFLNRNGGIGTIDEAFKRYDRNWSKDGKLSKAGAGRGFRQGFDELAASIADEPDLISLIGDIEDSDAGYRMVEIASRYERLPDSEKVALGRQAADPGYHPALDAEREAWENSDEGREFMAKYKIEAEKKQPTANPAKAAKLKEAKPVPARLLIDYYDKANKRTNFESKDLKNFALEKIPGKKNLFYFKTGSKTLAEIELYGYYHSTGSEKIWVAIFNMEHKRPCYHYSIYAREDFNPMGAAEIKFQIDKTIKTDQPDWKLILLRGVKYKYAGSMDGKKTAETKKRIGAMNGKKPMEARLRLRYFDKRVNKYIESLVAEMGDRFTLEKRNDYYYLVHGEEKRRPFNLKEAKEKNGDWVTIFKPKGYCKMPFTLEIHTEKPFLTNEATRNYDFFEIGNRIWKYKETRAKLLAGKK